MSNFMLSIFLVFLAGIFQGTFGLGMKKFSPFSWEAFWILFSITGMLVIPICWSSFAASGTMKAISTAKHGMIAGSMVFGALWGVGSILFGLAILWFAALGVYGQGAALMGKLGPAIGWTMFLALSLIISTGWGLVSGEWKGTSKPKLILFIGNGILIIAWIILGYANSLMN